MRRAEWLLFPLLAAMGLWIAVQASEVHRGIASTSAARIADARPVSSHAHSGRTLLPTEEVSTDVDARTLAAQPVPNRDIADIRRRITAGETGTYIGEILAARDSNIARWPDRMAHPLRIWVQSADSLADWNPLFVDRVRDAFSIWSNVGIPVSFAFVLDSSAADVHVTFVDHFDEQISGKTKWSRDENWWIVQGNIAIALHHNHGESLDPSAIRAIALHEVGHLLGLDHCSDTNNIMAPRVHIRELAPADIATMRLIYSVPPGSVRAGAV